MAKNGKEIDKLYISIGLNTDDLKVGFEKTSQTMSQYVSKLNNEAKNIKLKMDVDLSKLELSGSELDKLKVKAKALQQQLEIAQKKQSISSQAYALNAQKYGQDNAITQKSQTIDLYRQKDVANLQAQIAAVNKQMQQLGPTSKSAFSQFAAGAKSAGSSLSGLTGGITAISAKWTAALAVIGTGAGFLNITESAMKAGEQLYQIQNRLKTTASEAAQLKKLFAMSDSDVMMMPAFMARLQKSYTATGEAGKAFRETLSAYGISLTDTNGKLLGTTQTLEQLAIGLQNARKSGDEEGFSMDVLGARGQALMPVLDQLQEKMDIIKKTGSTGLLNAQEAHELYLQFQQLQLQVGDLKGAIGKALLPIAEELMPPLIQTTKEFCDTIKENKENIRDAIEGWGTVFGELAKAIAGVTAEIGNLIKAYKDLPFVKENDIENEVIRRVYGKEAVDRGKSWATMLGGGSVGAIGAFFGGTPGAVAGTAGGVWGANEIYNGLAKMFAPNDQWDYYKKQVQLEQWEAEQRKKTQKAIDDKKKAEKEATDATKENTEATKANGEAQKLTASQTKERNAATRELRKELTELTHSDYDNKVAALSRKISELKEKHVDDNLIADYYTASMNKINKSVSEGVFEPMSKAFNSDFQNSLAEIDAQARKYKEQAGSALSDDQLKAWVARRKSQITSDWDRQVAEQIDSIWNTELTNQLNRIEREKRAWIQKGLDEVKATRWAEEQKKQAVNDSVKNMFTSQKKYLQLYRNAMAGQVSAEGGMYDFTQSQGDRQQNAIKAIRRLMMQEAGVSPNERTSIAEIQGFQKAMKEANNWGVGLVKDGNAEAINNISANIIDFNASTSGYLESINSEVPSINNNLVNIESAIKNKEFKIPDEFKAENTKQKVYVDPEIPKVKVEDKSKDTSKEPAKDTSKENNKEIKIETTDNNKIAEILTNTYNEIPKITSEITALKDSLANVSNNENLTNLNVNVNEGNNRIVDVLNQTYNEIPKVISEISLLKDSLSNMKDEAVNENLTNLSVNVNEGNNRIVDVLNQTYNEIPKVISEISLLKDSLANMKDETVSENINSLSSNINEGNNRIVDALNQNSTKLEELQKVSAEISSFKDSLANNDNNKSFDVLSQSINEGNNKLVELINKTNSEIPKITSEITLLKDTLANINKAEGTDNLATNISDGNNRIVEVLTNVSNEIPQINASIANLKDSLLSNDNNKSFDAISSNINEGNTKLIELLNQTNNEIPKITSEIVSLKDSLASINSAEGMSNLSTNISDGNNRISEILTNTYNEIPKITAEITSLKDSLNISDAESINTLSNNVLESNNRIIEVLTNTYNEIPSINTNITALKDSLMNNTAETVNINNLSTTISEGNSQLAGLLESINNNIPQISASLSSILEKVSQRAQQQAPNINVSPNINVNLGGAYVFDNAMKQQLTDDITREVANGVTQAVNEATSQIQTGFAN